MNNQHLVEKIGEIQDEVQEAPDDSAWNDPIVQHN